MSAILHFPSLDALRLALTSGAIPEAVRSAAARYAFGDDGSLWVQPAATLPAKAEKELRRLGLHFASDSKIPMSGEAAHWLQLFPLVRDSRFVEPGDKTPVLFELTKEGKLAEVATEILRLGNDRQSFRWLDDADESKALLRVIGPPYYSLLRAIDHADQDCSPLAYREVGPRVWLQVGYTHPLGEYLKAPAGEWLLIRSPHRWTSIPEAKLRDIYEVIDFQLPETPYSWHDTELPAPIRVPVRLTRSGAAEPAELWVLREAGIVQLEDFVRSSDNELLGRFAFAVGEIGSERIVALRARPSKNPPPVLVLDGAAFRSYLRIPNLFLPIGLALDPPLRRDAVVKLLGEDRTRLIWLTPSQMGSGEFTPESLPDNAFRPLSEWVDYVLEHEHQAIKTWLSATQFEFESFICKDDVAKEKKAPKAPTEPKQAKKTDRDESELTGKDIDLAERKKPKQTENVVEHETKIDPSELEKRLRALEESYNAMTTPLEDPDRQTIWREMARLNGALNQHSDAAVCWSNAFWEVERVSAEWPRDWFRLEAKQPVGPAPPTPQVLRILNSDTPTHANVRLVTAYLIWAAALPTLPCDLRPNLGAVQQYLLKHETFLGVRTVWLAWHAIYRLSGDVLMLARARDRMLERLHLHGLTPELDLPGFLRFTGLQANHRFRLVRDQIVRLRRLVQDWANIGPNPTPETHAYIDLIFAFGLARLGETTEVHSLLRDAAQALANADEVHSWLYEAFAYRVQQALDGKLALDRLPDALLQRLEAIERPDYLQHVPEGKQRQDVKDSLRFQRLKIDRMREKSRILEPLEKIDSYRRWHGRFADELTQELASLTDIHDRVELIGRLQRLLTGKQKFKGASTPEARILAAALELAPRLGLVFGEEVLDRVPALIGKLKDTAEITLLLEKSLLLAAHCDRKEDVQRFVARFEELLQNSRGLAYDQLITLFAGSFRSLRKFGLRDAVAQILHRLGEIVSADKTLQAGATSALASGARGKRFALLLELAAGWLFFGDDARARKVLDEARDAVVRKELLSVDLVKTACAYLTALGQAPMEFALARVMEFFRKADGIYDNWTTVTHYSLTRLTVVEAMMLALINDDFTLDPAARQRLDDDEYLVRRRIHRDVRDGLQLGGPTVSVSP